MRHPDWAAAYVLVDWNKRGRKAVKKVTEAYENHEKFLEYEFATDEAQETNLALSEKKVRAALDDAITRMEVYVQALKDARDRTE